MSEIRALRSLATKVEKLLANQQRNVLVERASRLRGSMITLQPTTREVLAMIDALNKAKAARPAKEKAK